MTSECAVSGCDSPAGEIFELPHDGLALARGVCAFHHTALMEGENWALERSGLLMGNDLDLEMINWSSRSTLGNDVVTLELGRDGTKSQQVSFRVDAAMVRRLCHWVADGDHPDDFNAPRE